MSGEEARFPSGGCPRCGAVTTARAGAGGYDNSGMHAEFHRKQDDLLKAHDEMLKSLTGGVLDLVGVVADEAPGPLVFTHSGIGVCNKGRRHVPPCDYGNGV